MRLKSSTTLQQRFRIEGALEDGSSFVNTYRAVDQATNERILIREYFPQGIAERSPGGREVWAAEGKEPLFTFGRKQFLKEGQAHSQVSHEVVATLVSVFEEHGTTYQVVKMPQAVQLERVLKKRKKPLPQKAALKVTSQLLKALGAVHKKGLIHGQIGARHVYVTKDGAPRLLSFQTAQILTGNKAKDPSLLTDTPVAPEQTSVKGKQGPWSDIYATAALFHHLLTGEKLDLPEGGQPATLKEEALSPAFVAVLQKALSVNPKERIRAPKKLFSALRKAAKASAAEGAAAGKPPHQKEKTADKTGSAVEQPSEKPVTDDTSADASTHDTEQEVAPSAQEEPGSAGDAGAEIEEVGDAGMPGPSEKVEDVTEEEAAPPAVASGKGRESDVADEVTDSAEETEESPAKPNELAGPISELPEMIVVDEEGEAEDKPAEANVEHGPPESTTKVNVEEQAEEVQEDTVEAKAESSDDTGETVEADYDEMDESGDVREPEADRDARANNEKYSRAAVRKAMMGAALLLVVALAGGAYFFTMQGTETAGLQYASLTAQADSLFEAEDYAMAGTFYQQARSVQPDDAHVQERLAEAERKLAEEREEAVRAFRNHGDRALARADSMLEENESLDALAYYREANRAYLEALRNSPEDEELPALIDRTMEGIDRSFQNREQAMEEAQPDPQAMEQELFERYWVEGNQLLEEGDLAGAERRLTQAQELQPENAAVAELLESVQDSLRQQSVEETYRGHLDRASTLEAQQRWSEASVEYQRALNVQPGGTEAMDGIARVEDALEEAQRNEQQYQYLRGQGDVLSNQGRYQEALQSYRQALEFRPESSYLSEQVAAMEAEISAMEAEERRQRRTREDGVYLNTDTPVTLVGSLSELYSEIEYPRSAIRAGVSGRVFVQFVVTADGQVRDAEVIRGIGAGADEEAVRVVEQASFEPATVDGQPVAAQHTLFIEFSLEDANGDE